MKDHSITTKQFYAAVFVALLSPLTRAVPRVPAALAGKGAWLGAFPAFLLLLALARLMLALRRRLLPGEGMGGLILRLAGPWAGRLVLMLYGGWFLLCGGAILQSGAERLAAAAYPQSREEPFMLILLAVSLLMALGTLRAAARTAVVTRAVLIASLAFVFLLAAPNLSPGNLLPLRPENAPGIAAGGWPVLAAGGTAALFSFLDGYREPDPPSLKNPLPHLALFCGLSALLCLETVGAFGPRLTARLNYPFFTLTRDVSLFGLAQRIEAVVIALWVFADIVMCALLLRCAYEAFRAIFRLPKTEDLPLFCLRRGRCFLWAEAAAMYAAGQWMAATPARFLMWTETLLPLVTTILTFGGFSLLWIVGKARKAL